MLSDCTLDSIQREMTERVQRGIRKLDAYFQHGMWRKEIDHSTLNLKTYEDCVLGQLFVNFSTGIRSLGITDSDFFGFSADDIVDECDGGHVGEIYNMLSSTWNDEADAYEYEGMPTDV